MDNGTAHHENPNVLYHELGDEELIERSQRGDAQALEQLYYNHRDRLLKFAWMVSGNQDLAVEAVNHAFEALFDQLRSIGQATSTRHFLFEQVCSVIRDEESDLMSTQANWEMSADSIAGEGDWTGPGSPPELSSETEQFIGCFSSLPQPLRISAGLRLIGLFSINDIIQINKESAQTVRARLDEALRRLRVCLQEDDVQTHTGNCSMAGERAWLQFVTSNSSRSSSSDLTAHREKCEECQTVHRGIEHMMERVQTFRDFELTPFPKGDESDLLKVARETAAHLMDHEPDGPDMDPDLKQVMYLIPWGLALVLVISIAPLFVQQSTSDRSSTVSEQSATQRGVPVHFHTQEHRVKTIHLRVTSTKQAGDLQAINHRESARITTRRSNSDTGNSTFQTHDVHVTFTSPFPSGRVHVMDLTFSNAESTSLNDLQLDVLRATDREDKPVTVRVDTLQ